MKNSTKLVFFGSFHLSADILERLVAAGFMPSVVMCSPDRPTGRKKILTPPAIKQLILEKGWSINIAQPESPLAIRDLLLALQPDLSIVMGYPQIIPQSIIDLPRLGTIGIHPSLLPRYRGASPIQSVLLAGEATTGITLYQMDSKMDHGKIISSVQFPIASDETNTSLEKKCAEAGAKLLIETLPKILAQAVAATEQDHSQATYTKKFTTADAQIDCAAEDPKLIYQKIRALNPNPGAWTMNYPGREGTRVKLLAANWHDEKLKIRQIQPDGKKAININ